MAGRILALHRQWGVWTQMSADLDLGLVYLPTEAPPMITMVGIDQGITYLPRVLLQSMRPLVIESGIFR
ncbi:MAG: hypothetical protein Ct9H300mP22_5800 [Gammaproteobacteria bacterium]|nr:MAG: hypothetical protein Ct9H300mP22_5800 [Gammaproteobacteria bacterium]